MILEVKNLVLHFRGKSSHIEALRGVSFHLNAKEKLGIIGESGSGKSVTMKTILGLLSPQNIIKKEGSVLFEEKNLMNLSEKELQKIRGKKIAIIFQDPMTSLNPTMRIGDQIAEGVCLHHPELTPLEVRTRVITLLRRVGIALPEKRATDYPHMLSGGQRQRVAIAIALACEPAILIADEPTTALDVTVQGQILALLDSLQAEMGMSVIFITHDMSIVANFCNRAIVMYAGKIVESANVSDLFHSPKHPYTQGLLAAIPRIDTNRTLPLLTIPGSPPNMSAPPLGCAFHPRCPHAMEICVQEIPSDYSINESHLASCFLNDQRCPCET